PLARRAAVLQGVGLAQIRGSGPGGLVRRDDVVASQSPRIPLGPAGSVQAVPIKGSAAVLVEAMEESLHIPTATSFRTVEVPVMSARRRQLNEALRADGRSELKVSFTHLIAFALVRAAAEMPAFAASFVSLDGKPSKLLRQGVNLGLAVDVERSNGTRFLL
ncbi:branched-chain alpha-keto acid dehydrogenase subunit E2, partial [mine drainage metagenome]